LAQFRDIFIKAICKAGNIIPAKLLLNITQQRLIIPFYHIISDENPPHIRHLYPVKGVKRFMHDLDFFLKLYEPLNYLEFQELVKNKRSPVRPSFLLTFDDGLKEFHDVIAPLLIQKGVPAICFLNSGFIDNKDLFYRFKASLLIDHLANNPKLLSDKKVIDWISAYSDGIHDISQLLLSISYKNKQYLDDIALLVNYDFKEFLSIHKPYLTSSQIHSLKNKGFHFGAHSIDHPEYRFTDFDEQIRQTKESIESICSIFSLDYRTFSFPYTDFNVSRDFFNKVYNENIVDITFGCAGQKREVFLNHFQRISFERDYLTAKEIYNSELLYFIFKAFFGRNTIKR
jgi:peptidoglycan/xylan/chitin deacetylase (PgdA/CDA1 family)